MLTEIDAGECLPNSTSALADVAPPFGAAGYLAANARDSDRHRLFTSLPSFITIGLSVILLAIAVALLFYAKQTGKLHLSNLSPNSAGGGGANVAGSDSANADSGGGGGGNSRRAGAIE